MAVRDRPSRTTNRAWALAGVGLLCVAATACAGGDEQDVTAVAGPAGSGGGSACPVAHDGASTVVLSGDFDGSDWCLEVSRRHSPLPCLSISGQGAPEGEALASGACSPSFSVLGWHVTDDGRTDPLALVIYGHAAARTTVVRFVTADGRTVDVRPQRHADVADAAFFATRVPADFFPSEAVALVGDHEIERRRAPVVQVGP